MKKLKSVMQKIYDNHKNLIEIFLYMIMYLIIFTWIENRHVIRYHVIYTKFDSKIPFCEYFIIPYMLWFLYVVVGVVYIDFRSQEEGRRLIQFLMIGMTLFLAISILYPNIQFLRPRIFKNDNIFTRLIGHLYKVDTNTNILPSIHVYNSLAIMIACKRDDLLRKYPFIKAGIIFLGVSIILSTMFIKQHSIIDVTSACIMGIISYSLCYKLELQPKRKTRQQFFYSNK